jgi:cytochrome oxidase Cu insertion factor (SCO1/SenC/PrrC family)
MRAQEVVVLKPTRKKMVDWDCWNVAKFMIPALGRILVCIAAFLLSPVVGQEHHHHEPGPQPSPDIKFPDLVVLDQEGHKLRFYNDLIKDKIIVLSFFATGCDSICPSAMGTFAKLQEKFGRSLGDNVVLIAISTEPASDTPARLKEYAVHYGAKAGWVFVTGEKETIEKIRLAFNLLASNRASDLKDHNHKIIVGSEKQGNWTYVHSLSSADHLARIISVIKAGLTVAKAGLTGPDKIPDLTLRDQHGKPHRFYSELVKGKTAIINFFFTTCTSVCPTMMGALARVQQKLGDRLGKDINMLSITVDPEIDTPSQLLKYGRALGVRPGWYLLTGTKEDIDSMVTKLSGYQLKDKNEHTSLLIIYNEPEGAWLKTMGLGPPEAIVKVVDEISTSP